MFSYNYFGPLMGLALIGCGTAPANPPVAESVPARGPEAAARELLTVGVAKDEGLLILYVDTHYFGPPTETVWVDVPHRNRGPASSRQYLGKDGRVYVRDAHAVPPCYYVIGKYELRMLNFEAKPGRKVHFTPAADTKWDFSFGLKRTGGHYVSWPKGPQPLQDVPLMKAKQG